MKLLVGADGTKGSLFALARCMNVAKPGSDEVHIVAVYDPLVKRSIYTDSKEIEEANKQDKAHLQDSIKRAEAVAEKKGVAFKSEMLKVKDPDWGCAADEIARYAQENEVSIIFIGKRAGMGPIESFLMGSTSLKLTKNAPCSVWVTHTDAPELPDPTADHKPLTYGVGLDGSEVSKKALDLAARLKRDGDKYVLLSQHKSKPESKKTASDVLLAGEDEAKRLNLDFTSSLLEGADPREELQNAAGSHSLDVLALGTRGMGAIKRLLLGSVSQHLVEQSDRDVLIVR